MGWLIYILAVLLVSAVIGAHLGRFGAAYTEMTGMMAGMTMGMLNGFVLGYAAAAALRSMFWGNLFGIFFGLLLGIYFGRAGGLMGVLDGGMGGVMGGSMGAMLAAMIFFPEWALLWTAGLVGVLFLGGMAGLVVLIERSAPHQAALHRLTPLLRPVARPAAGSAEDVPPAGDAALVNYYELLDIPVKALLPAIATAYGAYIATADAAGRDQAAQALATLSDPTARAAYDRALAVANGRDPCCPPPRRSSRPQPVAAPQADLTAAAPEPVPAPPAPRPLVDYYRFLGIHPYAGAEEIEDAYLLKIEDADAATVARADQAWTVLSDPQTRAQYDQALARNRAARAAGAPAVPDPPAPGQLPRSSTRPARAVAPSGRAAANAGAAQAPQGEAPTPATPRRAGAPPPRGPRDRQPAREPGHRAARPPAPPIRRPAWLWSLAAVPILIIVGASVAFNNPESARAGSGGPGIYHVPPAGQPSGSTTIDARLLAQAVPAPVVNGVQTLDVVVNGNTFQYEPAVIKVKAGIPVRFNLSAKGEPGCGRPVLIRGLGAQGQAAPGQVTTMDFTPTQTGQFAMTCPMGMFGPGTLIVTQ